MNQIELTPPKGTSGLACEPWTPGEIYAVAADWSQAAAPVWLYGAQGWERCGDQVADFRHRPMAALRAAIVDAIATSEGIPRDAVDDCVVDACVADAVRIG